MDEVIGRDAEVASLEALNVDPPSGSQVEPGDEIVFDVTAQEARSGLSWQTGVRDLRVKAIPGEDLVPQERADASTPQPCDRKQWSLATQGSYEVPDDPPPTFKICPIANDFAGNQNADTCATYHTGDVWEGRFTYDFSGSSGAPPCSSTYSVEFTVSGGRVSGEVVLEENSCPGASPRDQITGTSTEETLVLAFFGGNGSFPIVDNRVTAQLSSFPQIESRTLDVRCVSCEQP